MRADRLLTIMLLLQVHGQVTASELANRLEVSERTIYRDMEALSAAGIPVTSERGIGGGLKLFHDYQTNLTGLTESEIFAVFLNQSSSLMEDLGLHETAKAAFLKLLASLPGKYKQNIMDVGQRVYIDMTSWRQTDRGLDKVPILQEAIWKEKKLKLTYEKGDQLVERIMDPLGLVAKGTGWYLVGLVEGDIRTYRVSRIAKIQLSEETSIRPENFDLAEYWKESSNNFIAQIPKYPVKLKVNANLAKGLRNRMYVKITEEAPSDKENWIVMHVNFESLEDACENILGYGSLAEVLEPICLKEKVINTAKNIVKFYEEIGS